MPQEHPESGLSPQHGQQVRGGSLTCPVQVRPHLQSCPKQHREEVELPERPGKAPGLSEGWSSSAAGKAERIGILQPGAEML